MQTYDIAIIGGGIAGLSLAYFLGADRSVVVLEREESLGYHSTGRSAAEFVLRYNSPEVCKLAAISRDFFDHPPAGFSDVPLLSPRGGLMIANVEKRERFEAHFAAEQMKTDGLQRLSVDEAVTMMPILDPAYVADAYYDPEFWDIEVECLLQGYGKGVRRAGVEIRQKAGVNAARDDGRHWRIDTEIGSVAARIVVNATGGWVDPTARLFGLAPLGIIPHRRTAILVDLPDGVDARTMPEINELDDEFYIKPDAGRLLVSPADETPCEPGDVQPEELDVAWAVHHLETSTTMDVRRVAKSWAGMRSFAPDRLPVVGFAKDHARFFWLAGQGGYGILSSPALGALAAALLTASEAPEDFARAGLAPTTFSPQRF
ncbi:MULTISPECIES: NAD(P)/FAD-dependent oxidoreductase [Alphaproteobacteria]|uniref:Glycerol-3-phosphate dehydrogenase n=2 Tax=Alphaproteobacteria TaxID=28211 RepID=A0A512HDR9_9HYPH|nr:MULTISPECIES: FAD-binding oxidoreductase [Alphaproteobacteria]GEO83602.1 glycerol-3-phosphate dehydrogenase [Ciceribacter naphthalenivorans]GLR24246.1 glycerol-3-phosphate dehydrogenase [Ciceribacter naphthalenivorans]GLT07102.1 glycerol-3-phosphate dehydrogenase [Sphingomonas psychrolutea]